ncbi:MAG: hypothetical protein IIU41_03070 [Oscillospiraceae bacterium]|nr:hypothetical protein [Oscillospiraceae bacterium]
MLRLHDHVGGPFLSQLRRGKPELHRRHAPAGLSAPHRSGAEGVLRRAGHAAAAHALFHRRGLPRAQGFRHLS